MNMTKLHTDPVISRKNNYYSHHEGQITFTYSLDVQKYTVYNTAVHVVATAPSVGEIVTTAFSNYTGKPLGYRVRSNK